MLKYFLSEAIPFNKARKNSQLSICVIFIFHQASNIVQLRTLASQRSNHIHDYVGTFSGPTSEYFYLILECHWSPLDSKMNVISTTCICFSCTFPRKISKILIHHPFAYLSKKGRFGQISKCSWFRMFFFFKKCT